MEEEVRSRFAVLHVIGTEEPVAEAIEQTSLRQVAADLREVAARRDTGLVTGRLDRVDRLGHAVDGLELLRERLEVADVERRPFVTDVAAEVVLDLGLHRRLGPADPALDDLGLGQRPAELGQELGVEPRRQPLAVDEDAIAIEDDEVERPAQRAAATSRDSADAWRGRPGSGTQSLSERTSARCAVTAGSIASAAATAVSMAVRQRIPSPVAARRISAASRTAPDRGVGVFTTSRTSPEAMRSRIATSPAAVLGSAPSFATGRASNPADPRSARVPAVAARRYPAARSADANRGSESLSRSAIDSSANGPLSGVAGPGGTGAAPVSAFASATRGSALIPITSPVDCMPGPTDGSTPRSFAVENAGALTATNGGDSSNPFGQPRSASRSPSEIRMASSTIGTPVTFDMNGTVREARGLTSMRYTPSSRTMNCALHRPRAPSSRTTRSIVATISSRSPSPTVCGGNIPTLSPLWTPARSTCSSRPGIRTRSPSLTASTSTSIPSR